MSNNNWNVESDNLDAEELSDAELSDIQGGSSIGDLQNLTQYSQQVIAGDFNEFNVQSSNQTGTQIIA